MGHYRIAEWLGGGLATIATASLLLQVARGVAQPESIWYNCLTREVFTPEKQAWCDRWQALQNATYIVPIDTGEEPTEYTTVTLDNGRYRTDDETLIVELVNQEGWLTFGDVTGDGRTDAAAILGVGLDPEGTSLATYLTAVLDVEGEAQALLPIRLGERILLNGPITIQERRIVLPFLTMTAVGVREFVIEDDRLSELASELEPSEPSIPILDGMTLEETLWYLTSYTNPNGETVAAQTYTDSPAILFQDGQVSGHDGCNRFLGSYRIDEDGTLTVHLGGSTLIACPQAFAAQASAVSSGLSQVTSFAIVDDELQLLNVEGETLMTFNRANLPALTGTLWDLVAYNNGQGGVVSLIPNTRITATFDREGRLTGTAGCNRYLAGYQTTETTIEISPGASTRMFCGDPEGVMDQEAAYLQALETAHTFAIEGNTLTLKTASGETVARFIARESEE